MKIAIMQPYLFPSLRYFQLISAVDKFVFYDDVNFIKSGWINRNRILINGKEFMFSAPLKDLSSFREIQFSEINKNSFPTWKKKFLASIELSYKKAPNFKETFDLIHSVLLTEQNSIGELAIDSVVKVCQYLEIATSFEKSSSNYSSTKGLAKENRIFEICKLNNILEYVNPIGGMEIYDKDHFHSNGINLMFIDCKPISYKQFLGNFIEGLSIIDVLMFNNKQEIQNMLTKYDLL
jgi:hypothetical protein